MARKKRATLKEIKAPDEFQVTMGKAFEFLKTWGAWIGVGAGVIVFGILLGVFISRYQAGASIDRFVDFHKAAAPVLAQPDPTAETVKQPTDEELKAATTAIDEFIKDNKRSKLALNAKLTMGAAALRTGDFETALVAFKEFAEGTKDPYAKLIAWEGYGEAADRLGKKAEAEQAFNHMAEAEGGLVKVNGLLHLGDLFNPDTTSEGADVAKARDFYEKALAASEGDESELPPAILVARKTVQARLSALP